MITVEDLDAFGYYFYAISLRAGLCEYCIKEGFEEIVEAIRATNALKADLGRHQCFGTPCPERTCHSKWRNMILKLTTTRSLLQKWTFGEAYKHPDGTHVVQTHGTDADLQRMVRGEVSTSAEGSSTAQRVGVGFLSGGPAGAAIGAATSGSRFGNWYELPTPIITAKPTRL